MKKVILFFTIIMALLLSAVGYYYYQQIRSIDSYTKCIAAGNPSLESYPPQCKTLDGRTFTKVIGNELQYSGEIQVEYPQPDQLITSPMTIKGKIRGNWLYEGTSIGELTDANNVVLNRVIISAEGNWMTDEFVNFTGTFDFLTPKTSTGTLKIVNSNPSGLSENEKTLVIPIRFK